MQPHPELFALANELIENFSLRAATAEDSEFLYQLYASTRAEELDAAGFAQSEREAFCRMQFGFRQHHYGLHFAHAQDRILLWQGAAVGRELVMRGAEAIELIDIAIFPNFRGRGMGGYLLQDLVRESRDRQLPIELHVDQGSRALALYQRHGFAIVEDQFPNWFMRRKSDAKASN
jgi:ribosomal protein S18 acetylase RimI-like enzyme